MEIKFNTFKSRITPPSFKAMPPVETVTHYNIGMMANGYIGKIKVAKKSGEEAYLNLHKSKSSEGEKYLLKDDADRVIGEMKIKIKKFFDYDKYMFPQDPSHIFIDELRNYSNPETPYYHAGLEHYKDIGTRLIQIAQRRSDECMCNGNIELISKNESKPFYDRLGFKPPPGLNPRFDNMNKRYLPPEAKEPLSRIRGGL